MNLENDESENRPTSLLDELDEQQNRVILQLDDLNERIEALLGEWTKQRADEAA